MIAENKNYLTFVPFANFNNWSVQYLLETKNSYNEKYDFVKIGSFLRRNKTSINIENNVTYKRVTVKINNNGVYLRDTEKGINIGTKKQFLAQKGNYIISKIDARNGAFGIIPEELNNAIVTNDFPLFYVDEAKININFLLLITTTKEFIKFAQSCSSGTTNRQRMDVDLFLEQKIPLPTLEEQNRIVSNYNSKLELAQQQEEKAKTLEIEIERYLFDELGVEKMIVKPFVKGVLNVFNFSEIFDRWDYNKGSSSVFSILHQSKYPVKTLDEAFNFTNRSWNKKAHQEKTFTYVEMGGIDATLGIIEATNLEVSKAPSRATQIILTGDLIIGTTRPYLKKFAIVTEKNNENIASSAFQIIAPSEDYCLDYLLEYIKSEFGVKQFEYYMTGALYPAITSKDLRKVLIPFPPVEKQKQISNHINSIKAQIKELNALSAKNREEAIVEFEKEIFN